MRLAILAIVQPKALKTNTSKRTAELPWAELGVCGGKRGEAAPPEFQHTLSNSCCNVAPDASFPNPGIVDWQCKQVLDTYLARRYQAARKLNKRRNLKDVYDISAFTTRRTTHYYLPFCTTRNEGNERIIAKQELRQTAEHRNRKRNNKGKKHSGLRQRCLNLLLLLQRAWCCGITRIPKIVRKLPLLCGSFWCPL